MPATHIGRNSSAAFVCLCCVAQLYLRAAAMSFADKLSALRRLFGVPAQIELLPAIASMNALMEIVGEGALPAQVDALVAATGVTVVATAPAAPAPTSIAMRPGNGPLEVPARR